MSQLGDIESAIITRLSTATIAGQPAFATLAGAGGGNRPANRATIRRLRMPAALVSFVEAPLAPETRSEIRGARFSVLVADQSLRAASDPRQGDTTTSGVFALIDVARQKLDDFGVASGVRLVVVESRFIDADERVGIYELLYRAWPIDEVIPTTPQFNGNEIAGTHSDLRVEIGAFRVVPVDPEATPLTYTNTPRPIIWRGEIRASTHAQLTSLETNIESLIAARTIGTVDDVHDQSFDDCLIERYEREGPRRIVGTLVAQSAEILFSQLTPFA
ncbi:MAG TPA: DUF1834 family protein [Phycisphaerae bacterium]|nr:DUF1834 family protein [Phycisphaerae bacterium]HRW53832.1 DUF1834 family protein [Phycisphaerae bacterium]